MVRDDASEHPCTLKQKDYSSFALKNLVTGYCTLPQIGEVSTVCLPDHYPLYIRLFDFSGVRVPYTRFYLTILEYYGLNPGQLNPFGAMRVVHFELLCRALGFAPTLSLFRVYFRLARGGDWYHFERPHRGEHSCFLTAPNSCKNWKNNFVWAHRRTAPIPLSWRSADSSVKETPPGVGEYDAAQVALLDGNKVHIRSSVPESVLVLAGMSRNWSHANTRPSIRLGERDLTLLEFLSLDSWANVTYPQVGLLDDEPGFLTTTADNFVLPSAVIASVLAPPVAVVGAAPDLVGSSSAAGGSGVAPEKVRAPITVETSSDTSSDLPEGMSSRRKRKGAAAPTRTLQRRKKRAEPEVPAAVTSPVVTPVRPAAGNASNPPPEESPPADPSLSVGAGLPSLEGLILEQEVTMRDVTHESMNIGDFSCYGCNEPDHPGVPCRTSAAGFRATAPVSEKVVLETPRDLLPTGSGSFFHAEDSPPGPTPAAEKSQPAHVPEDPPVASSEPPPAPIYVPAWTVREDQTTLTGRVCREILNHFGPPRERERMRLIADEQLEVRANVVLAQNASVGAEMRNRWVQRTVELRRLQAQFQEQAEAFQQQRSDLEHLSAHLHSSTAELAGVKREAAASAARIAELEQLNSELYQSNQALELKASLPNLPEGHVSLPQSELDALRSSLDGSVAEVHNLRNVVLSKDREIFLSSDALRSVQGEHRALIERADAAVGAKVWLMRQGVKAYTSKLLNSNEFLRPFGEVCEASRLAGFADGVQAGFRGARLRQPLTQIPQYDATAALKYDDALAAFPQTQFPFFETLAASYDMPLESLRDLSPAGTDDDGPL